MRVHATLLSMLLVSAGALEAQPHPVEAYIDALNRGDREACVGQFAPDARHHAYQNELASVRTSEGSFDEVIRGWACTPPDWYQSWSVAVVERQAMGSFVSQIEEITAREPDMPAEVWRRLATYEVREGRIQNLWVIPADDDVSRVPEISDAAHPEGTGPTVWVDEGHFNYHRAGRSYRPLAELLRRDGYRVRAWKGPFTREAFQERRPDILVIANAMAEENARGAWALPAPSAFTQVEVRAVQEWVEAGGGLLLVSDHLPWGGAAGRLAAAFGALLTDGIAMDTAAGHSWVLFHRGAGLGAHPVTDGPVRVDSVEAFGGQAFQVSDDWTPLLTLPSTAVLWLPARWRVLDDDTPRLPAGGWSQAAARSFGQGRLIVSGEASLFRYFAQPTMLRGARDQNVGFVRNVFRWLAPAAAREARR